MSNESKDSAKKAEEPKAIKNPKYMTSNEIITLTRVQLEHIGPPIKTHYEAEAYLRGKNNGLCIKNTCDVMMEAARKGYVSIIRELEIMAFNIYCKNTIGESLLHAAARGGKGYSVRYLIMRGLDPNLQNTYGETPMMQCSEYGGIVAAEVMLKSAKIDLAITNKFGENALHLATRNGHQKVCELLLKKNITMANALNQNGKNPLNYAYDNGYQTIIESFKKYKLVQATDSIKESFEKLVSELIK